MILRRQTAASRAGPARALPPVDFDETAAQIERQIGRDAGARRGAELRHVSGRVHEVRARRRSATATSSVLPTPAFFYGMRTGEEIAVEIEPGKTIVVKFLTVGELRPDGTARCSSS